ncbi:hypothetical protein [Hydrogenophaga luteola]|uniref:Uncharacterized protein n=1 Tax=Hydrogenophaga luteola TaxID=1591122 RepID=A0ABV7W8D7_9BURK
MNRKPRLKRILHAASSILALAGILFVVLGIAHHWREIDISGWGSTTWAVLGISSVAYGAANILLARAWWHLLRELDVHVPWLKALRIYGVSQINKYIPGNIFHLAGRQTLGMAAGWAARPLATSALWELILLAALGALFGTLALPLFWPPLPPLPAIALWVGLSALIHAALRRGGVPGIARAMCLQTCFLATSGAVFLTVLMATYKTPPEASLLLPAACGAYVLAWLAGLVTPGAPAGVGVRETVLLFLLKGLFAPSDLLVAVVLGRIVTASGDVLFYLSALTLRGGAEEQA